jgi:hypothetical protein
VADVKVVWCKRRSKCSYCPTTIVSGHEMLVVRWWRPGKWTYTERYHPDCWLAKARAYLAEHPYTKRTAGGRPKLELTEQQRGARYLLLRRGAALRQRKRILAGQLGSADIEASNRIEGCLIRLDGQLDAIAQELGGNGGVPREWNTQNES